MTAATVIELQPFTPQERTTYDTSAARLFHVRPYTPHCQVICEEGDHAVIGVSPGNSYFSAQRINDLAAWGLSRFRQVDFVYTDVHVADMYEALGYSAQDAHRKFAKNRRGVRAKVNNAVTAVDPGGTRLRAHAMGPVDDRGVRQYVAGRGQCEGVRCPGRRAAARARLRRRTVSTAVTASRGGGAPGAESDQCGRERHRSSSRPASVACHRLCSSRGEGPVPAALGLR
ncbi:tRNA-dependent cyclodipeptide synthase [Streptomyces beihaiensis]|uniref:Cyclodipeptide synthase n=1 Tax=Streptomyces beihaiensis TaxID=2984495 RepID=A0ABT3TX70_9ACTN|nr:tRNA-dependent cyclodipeptide synthase [Streptomyces beihaiensis]MCX3061643.1 tRNA-dependent cyclodipeptide synthase [Streptomyces beihaiensis]